MDMIKVIITIAIVICIYCILEKIRNIQIKRNERKRRLNIYKRMLHQSQYCEGFCSMYKYSTNYGTFDEDKQIYDELWEESQKIPGCIPERYKETHYWFEDNSYTTGNEKRKQILNILIKRYETSN